MSRCFQTELKDILGGEEGIGQRHRAVKPHHSENLLSVNDCMQSQVWEAKEEAEGSLQVFCIVDRESLVKILSRVLTEIFFFFFLSLEMDFSILKILVSEGFHFHSLACLLFLCF